MSSEELRVAIQATREKWYEILDIVNNLILKAAEPCELCRWTTRSHPDKPPSCSNCPVSPPCRHGNSLYAKWIQKYDELADATVNITRYLTKLLEDMK